VAFHMLSWVLILDGCGRHVRLGFNTSTLGVRWLVGWFIHICIGGVGEKRKA